MFIDTIYAETSEISAIISTKFKVNGIGPSVQSSFLTDDERFPFYSRLVGSIETEGRVLYRLFKQYGWRTFATLSSNRDLDRDWATGFASEASSDNATNLVAASYDAVTLEVETSLLQIKNSGARIIAFAASGAHLPKIFSKAYELGLLQAPYVWLVASHVMFGTGWRSSEIYDSDSYVPAADAVCHTLLPNVFSASLTGDFIGRIQPWLDYQYIPGEPFYIAAVLSFDSVSFAAHALDKLVRIKTKCDDTGNSDADCLAYHEDDHDSVTLRRILRSQTVTSVNYYLNVTLDQNGDRVNNYLFMRRIPGSDSFDLANILVVESDGAVNGVTEVDKSKLFRVTWSDGTNNVPSDEPIVVYRVREIGTVTYIVCCALASIIILYAIACGVFNYSKRAVRVIRMSSPRINNLAAFGAVLVLSNVFLLGLPLSNAVCRGRAFLITMSFTLLFGPLFIKMHRVHTIFNTKSLKVLVKMSDLKLFLLCFYMILVDLFILGIWMLSDPLRLSLDNEDPVTSPDNPNILIVNQIDSCVSDHTSVWYALMFSWKGLLLIMGSYLSFAVRKVSVDALNDSKWVGMSIYTTSMLVSMLIPVDFVLRESNPSATFVFEACVICMCVFIVLSLVFVPKILVVKMGLGEEIFRNGNHIVTILKGGDGRSPSTPPTKKTATATGTFNSGNRNGAEISTSDGRAGAVEVEGSARDINLPPLSSDANSPSSGSKRSSTPRDTFGVVPV